MEGYRLRLERWLVLLARLLRLELVKKEVSFDPVSDGHDSSLKTVPASLPQYDSRMESL